MPKTARLSTLSVTDLHRELRRRQRRVGTIVRKRNRLARQLRALDAEIAASGGRGVRGGGGAGGKGGSWSSNGHVRTRPRNKMSLVDALAVALKGKTLSVMEAAAAVQKAGYKTTSLHFRTMVNIALGDKKKFKRVERGRYTAV